MSASDSSMPSQPYGPPDVTALPPDVSSVTPQPDISSLPNQPAPQAPQLAQPQKPSMWKQILQGALTGLAASTQVNGRGVSGGSAFAGGLAAGAGAELQSSAQQKAAQSQVDYQKLQTAHAYVQLQAAQRALNLMPDDKREQFLNQEADNGAELVKAGAVVPLSEPADVTDAQSTLSKLHAANPWAVYSIQPVKSSDGTIQYQAVQFVKAPLQAPVTLEGLGPDGGDIQVPAGVSAADLGKSYHDMVAKKAEGVMKQNLQDSKDADQRALKQTPGAPSANAKPDRNFYEGVDQSGNAVAGTTDELNAVGVRNFVKMPALTQTQTLAARELTDPNGLFQTAANQVRALNQAGKLGPIASRWNNFWAGKGLDGDQQTFRDTLGLIATKLMQAHMGNRGGKDAMEHFAELVPQNGTPDVLMKTLNNEYQYVNALAKRPKAVSNGN